MSDFWSRFSRAKSKLSEQALALSDPQYDSPFISDKSRQCFSVPEVAVET
jgi:hypothetical protein